MAKVLVFHPAVFDCSRFGGGWLKAMAAGRGDALAAAMKTDAMSSQSEN